jgi:arginase
VDVRILCVPWDAGHRDERMGRGPDALLRGGLAEGLRSLGHDVSVETVDPDDGYFAGDFRTEVATSFSLWHRLMDRVAAARGEGRFPVVLTGNCGASLGVVGGLEAGGRAGSPPLGVVWMDAHGDFNTPDTSASGFLDGMSLAALVGRCWRALTLRTPGFAVPEPHVLHLGGRDLDPAEVDLFAASGVRRLGVDDLRADGRLGEALSVLAGRVGRLSLHVDLDVLDPRVAPANTFVAPRRPADVGDAEEDDGNEVPPRDGVSPDELVTVASQVAERIRPEALTVSAYDPAADPAGRVPPVALRIVAAVLAAVQAG